MGLRFGDEFTQLPESLRLGFVLSDRRIENAFLLERRFEHAFDQGPDTSTGLRVGEFHQHIVREPARERRGSISEVLQHEREARVGE